ncbi:5-formyltetrahydrofolate cyclo-ligase [Uliginosibacterium sp. H1]|uniref:5-formyltetrahydrofolate cyclo-ligase n=1 Tax=Uliginosibacterium sp. H1 TaxID=3114757 RepID=UPI002E1829A9|nr:5-formyltetrahydrofolate cyclo-ligase [Uliginosibacterium sp. H1]
MSPSTPDAPNPRKVLRERLIAARCALDVQRREQFTAAIAQHLSALLARQAPTVVGFCWPYRGEVDLRAAVAAWLAGGPGRVAALPVVDEAGMHFSAWAPDTVMTAGRYDIPVPAEDRAVQPDLLLVPVNAFDARGYRLGYGGGYFDRSLARWLPRPVTVGVGFSLAAVEDLLAEAHDIPMDWIVTENGVVVGPQA